MENDHYNDSLKDAVKKLAVIREIIFSSVFNLAMVGELKEWSNNVEIGETHEFSKAIFEGCSDTNIQLLTKLMSTIEDTCNSLCNLNNIN